MKVVITSQGIDLTAPVDTRFGRAKHFICIDTETLEFEAVDNSQNLNAAQGAGIQAGKNVVSLNAEAVITGHVGPKAFATLSSAEIDIFTGATGSVSDALEQFKAGKLEKCNSADVDGHW